MDILQQLPQLENLCQRLYTAEVYMHANETLKGACWVGGSVSGRGGGHIMFNAVSHQSLSPTTEPVGEDSSGADVGGVWPVYRVHCAPHSGWGPRGGKESRGLFATCPPNSTASLSWPVQSTLNSCLPANLSLMLIPPPPLLIRQAILDNSSSPYAQYMAASSLLKLVTEHSLR